MSEVRWQVRVRMNMNVDCLLGEVVELRSATGAPLPAGTGDGFQVRLIALHADGGTVERAGHEWRVTRDQIRRRCGRPALAPAMAGSGRCLR